MNSDTVFYCVIMICVTIIFVVLALVEVIAHG
jgi:hypothetical protein